MQVKTKATVLTVLILRSLCKISLSFLLACDFRLFSIIFLPIADIASNDVSYHIITIEVPVWLSVYSILDSNAERERTAFL